MSTEHWWHDIHRANPKYSAMYCLSWGQKWPERCTFVWFTQARVGCEEEQL